MKKLLALFALLITFYFTSFGQSRTELARKVKDQNTVIEQIGKDNFTLKQNVDELQKAVFALLSKKDTTIVLNGQEFQVIVKDGVSLIQDGQAVIDEAKKSNPNSVWGWVLAIAAAIAKFGGLGFINSLLVRAKKVVGEARGFTNGKPRFVLYAMLGSVVGAFIFEGFNGGEFLLENIPAYTSYVFLASVSVYELGFRPFQKWRDAVAKKNSLSH